MTTTLLNPGRYFSPDPAVRKVAGELYEIVASLPLVWRGASANWLAGLIVRHIIDMDDAREMIQDLVVNLARRAYKL